MDDITSEFIEKSRQLDEGSEPPTIERTVTYRGETLAAVYVEPCASEITIAWPVVTGIDLQALFDAYYEFAGNAMTSVEWWIGDEFFERSLSPRQEIKSLARDLREQEERIGSPLDLVQLVCPDLIFEVTFGGVKAPAPAARLAVEVKSISQQLLSLFSRFHRNQFVRTDEAVARKALKARWAIGAVPD